MELSFEPETLNPEGEVLPPGRRCLGEFRINKPANCFDTSAFFAILYRGRGDLVVRLDLGTGGRGSETRLHRKIRRVWGPAVAKSYEWPNALPLVWRKNTTHWPGLPKV
ncbi:hypothetical protein AVEN_13279-1 [Araneus ventricosus]|uniref:Uncharacterized protein n=1 Tax=Araneus ventricosus TaxID=182803 RepID=A0A4Y2EYF2_ARAVE|nr:hypothetical protein AVEN_13279-1 [Araneus ventricosus]